jgi:hypothetical protein
LSTREDKLLGAQEPPSAKAAAVVDGAIASPAKKRNIIVSIENFDSTSPAW